MNQSLVEQKDEFDEAKEQQDQILAGMVPTMNKEATKLVDVYRIPDLIERDILDSLNDEAISVLKADPTDLP